ncbi:hydroxymethylglutaryl-CoA lyase [Sphingomonas sp. MG17]|uniref:Hydroxymethylglutaryl-CoA lyase n=1 Tax=Sphingomonas tagetis TaxID=2949092 RepID=A0A9X2HGG2_9SPHN|nr:hydroxymethylglutaryl-CoA lyase [Sphingomonas tagetis]MCP3730328.1 hydroxymethylglutaryl-CoA lyase [Sphingomonas tagetis]
MTSRVLTLVEVGPRDGFQSIDALIPTAQKLKMIDELYDAGVRRMEATAFVSDAAVPQLADAGEVMSHAQSLDGLDVQVLVPNLRHAERALAAGARHLAFVLSVSERHNRGNVRRAPLESAAEYARIVAALPDGVAMRLNVATAFDCPHDGLVAAGATLALLEHLVDVMPEAEICPCDTTGRVTPDRVTGLFAAARERFPQARHWAYHGHDTYGLGMANVLAAWAAGIDVIDASFGGLGGCPFAPGATGNVASEDVIWTFEQMGVETGIDLDALIAVARSGASLPGALSGGRVREVINAMLCLEPTA